MIPKARKTLFSLLVLLFAAAPAAGQAALADDHEPPKRTITISGKGSLKAAPDKVSVSAGVSRVKELGNLCRIHLEAAVQDLHLHLAAGGEVAPVGGEQGDGVGVDHGGHDAGVPVAGAASGRAGSRIRPVSGDHGAGARAIFSTGCSSHRVAAANHEPHRRPVTNRAVTIA